MNYVPDTDVDVTTMLETIGAISMEELFADIPANLRRPALGLPEPLSEMRLRGLLEELADRNANLRKYACFLGAGAYNHFIPSVVHHVTGRAEFYTAYTPYQAEASQGTLQTIFEYQTSICQLTGMDVSNSSMYDGATAVAEAAIMCHRATGRKKILAAPTMHPEYLAVLRTYTRAAGLSVIADWDGKGFLGTGKVEATKAIGALDSDTACLIVQQPNFFGCLEEVQRLAEAAHAVGALFVASVDPISLGILKAPGSYDADVVVGDGQPLGNAVSYGGPYFGLFATRERLVRQMPGRIVGQTSDAAGRRGFVLTLQTREQHIRREKATSNICTNEALNALAGTVYLAALGKQGLRRVAELCVQKAHYAAQRIAELPGFQLAFATPFYQEFVVRCPVTPGEINGKLLGHNILGGFELGRTHAELADCTLLCVTETNTKDEIDRLVAALAGL